MNSLNVKHHGKSICQLTRIHENFKEQYFRIIQSTSGLFERFVR